MKNKLQKVGFALAGGVATLVAMAPIVGQVQAQSTDQGKPTLGSVLKPSNIGGNLEYNELVSKIIDVVFIVAAAMTFFYLIFGAISWITSGGDKGKVEAARNKITAAVIGLLILAATWGAFTLIVQLFFGTGVDQVQLPSLNNPEKAKQNTNKK